MLDEELTLPGGGHVRGRALRRRAPSGDLPTFGLYLGSRRSSRHHDEGLSWPHRWLVWPDFRLPRHPDEAVTAVVALHRLATDAGERVEVGCGNGIGRTGTVLACLATLDGLGPDEAVAWVRAHHHRRAVETPWQRRWVHRFGT